MVKQRRGLGDLLRQEATNSQTPEDTEIQTPEQAEVQSTVVPEVQTPKVSKSQTSVLTESVSVPRYKQLTRKETRLREEQYEALTRAARRLNKTKRKDADRITENTLIRVAIDHLLEHLTELEGNDEAELLASLKRSTAATR